MSSGDDGLLAKRRAIWQAVLEDEYSGHKHYAYLQALFASGLPSDLPFTDHVRASIEFEVTREFESEGPEGGHDWRVLWEFTRAVKAHPSVRTAMAAQGLKELERALLQIPIEYTLPEHQSDPLDAAWEVHLCCSRVEGRAAFLDFWDKIRVLPDEGPLSAAWARAQQHPIVLGEEHATDASVEFAAFLSLAGWLQVTSGDRPIFLPTRKLAGILGMSHMTVSRWIGFAVKDGFLIRTAPHVFRSKGVSQAAEYRFDVSRVPMLKAAAHKDCGEGYDAARRVSL